MRKRNPLVRLWSKESGAAAVELALLATFVFVPLVLGATELGHRTWMTAQVNTAARAGIEYAALYGGNTNAINTAATSATRLTVTAISSIFTGCPTSTGVTPQTNGSACANGGNNRNLCER
jgi:Flp pilus assembly pilin Flp